MFIIVFSNICYCIKITLINFVLRFIGNFYNYLADYQQSILNTCFVLLRTYDYILRELPQVPVVIPILILANHRDMGHHRTVTEDQVRYFIDELNAER